MSLTHGHTTVIFDGTVFGDWSSTALHLYKQASLFLQTRRYPFLHPINIAGSAPERIAQRQ
jgi:hypothetical protein